MGDFKSKLPSLQELTDMAGKLFNDVKNSVSEIMDDYKQKRAVEEAQTQNNTTASTDSVTPSSTANTTSSTTSSTVVPPVTPIEPETIKPLDDDNLTSSSPKSSSADTTSTTAQPTILTEETPNASSDNLHQEDKVIIEPVSPADIDQPKDIKKDDII